VCMCVAHCSFTVAAGFVRRDRAAAHADYQALSHANFKGDLLLVFKRLADLI